MKCLEFFLSSIFLFLLSCLIFSLFSSGHPGWAPHAYFQKLAESNNGPRTSLRRARSLGMELHEARTSFIRHDKNKEIGETSPESTSPSLDSMEAGTSRY